MTAEAFAALGAAREIHYSQEEFGLHGVASIIERHHAHLAERYRTACVLISEQKAEIAMLRDHIQIAYIKAAHIDKESGRMNALIDSLACHLNQNKEGPQSTK